jgi:phosphopantothenoylcysteine decarboxylase / phosphopantothenate---cysteine ligase
MVEPDELVEWAGRALGSRTPWGGRRVLVTAGPTREPLDPVRYVGNRSSGRMGFALAREAWLRGADVTLVSGPSALPDPPGIRVERVETAVEMKETVAAGLPGCDLQIFAAAVGDFRPSDPGRAKRKRTEGGTWEARMVENPDVALDTRELRTPGSVTVGFALETDDLEANAREKLERKGFDMIVANDATEEGAGFDVETNRVTVVGRDGSVAVLPRATKAEVAGAILDRVEPMLTKAGAS